MSALAWIVLILATNAATLLFVSLCAAAGTDGAYREGYRRGREAGLRMGYAMAERAAVGGREEEAA